MDIVHIVPDGEYERYEELTLMKDRYEKDADLYQQAYIREFGELITESFQLKVECIALKKEIALYVKAKNAGEKVNVEDVRKFLETQMAGYYNELKSMIEAKDAAKKSRPISNYEAQQIKKLYRKLARLLHPDISPLTRDDPVLADYFNRIIRAYKRNDLKELRKLEVLVDVELEAKGIKGYHEVIPDAASRIEELERDIDMIIHSEPYTYKDLLEDDAAVAGKKDELLREIKEYRNYKKELTEKRDELGKECGYGG